MYMLEENNPPFDRSVQSLQKCDKKDLCLITANASFRFTKSVVINPKVPFHLVCKSCKR